MKKYYVNQSFTKIVEVEISGELKYGMYKHSYFDTKKALLPCYIPTNLCFDTFEDARDYLYQKLNLDLTKAKNQVDAVRNKILKIDNQYNNGLGWVGCLNEK